MPLPAVVPVVTTVAKILTSSAAKFFAVNTLKTAFKAGGLKGLFVALGTVIKGRIIAGFSFTALVSFFQSQAIFIYNFNFNATDEQLRNTINGYINQLAGMSGSAFGQTLGWVTCGAIAGSSVVKINPAAAAFVLQELGEEAAEEIIAAWSGLIRAAVSSSFRAAVTWAFMNIRRWMKKNPDNPLVRALFSPEFLQKWGEKGQPPLSMSKKVEDYFDSFGEGPVKAFLENAWEEFWESCSEAFFITANSLDVWMANQRNSRQDILGDEKIVEIKPNREIDQKIILAGREEILKPVIVQTLSDYQIMESKDIGQILGEPVSQAFKEEKSRLIVRLLLVNSSKPPLKKARLFKKVEITLKNAKRSKVDDFAGWKLALGGGNGYTSGTYSVKYKLSDRTALTCNASSEGTGEDILNGLLQFVEGTLVSSTCTEIRPGGNRSLTNNNLPRIEQVYPYQISISYAARSTKPDQPVRIADGEKLEWRSIRLPLWTDNKPSNWDREIAALFMGE